jgi:phosphatidylinositol glycan class W
MDIGVGSFVFSQGIISALPLLRTINATDSQRLGSHLLTSLRKCAPVLALGILRVLMVKGAEYPVR